MNERKGSEKDSESAHALPRMRLHRYIAACGYTSRRRAELLIEAGRVQVNGKLVTNFGSIVNPKRDKVSINGELISAPAPMTIIFHKPPGVITSTHDTHNRLTVMDLLPGSVVARGVLPVGRLDLDTEGLLVLTNDGDLSHRIAHPRYETEKEYLAWVGGTPTQEQLARLRSGVKIEGKMTAPARVIAETTERGITPVRVVIHEGRKRQVRRMLEVVGYNVQRLKRLRVGQLELGALPENEWRELTSEEIAALEARPPE